MFPGPSLGMSMLGCLATGMLLPVRWQIHCTATLRVLLRVWVVLAAYYRSGRLASDAAENVPYHSMMLATLGST